MKKSISFNIQLLNSDLSFQTMENIVEQFNEKNIIEKNDNYIIYKRNSYLDYPEWLKNFSSNIKNLKLSDDELAEDTKTNKSTTFLPKSSEGILLFIKVSSLNHKSRIFVLSFGTGRFSLKASAIEKGFGVYTTYHLSKTNGHQLKSYQSRLIDTNPINKKIAFSEEIDNTYGIPYTIDNERIKELVISNVDTSLYSRAIGKLRSLTISCSFTNEELPCLNILPQKLAFILDAYLSITDEEKQELYKGLVLVSSERRNELDALLIKQIKCKKEGELFLFEPEIDFDWTDVDKVVYSHNRKRIEDPNKEISLKKMLELGGINSSEDLKNITIQLIGNSSSILKTWTAYQCLYGEILTDKEVFIFSDEEYLQIQKNKYQRICDNVQKILSIDTLPQNIQDDVQKEIDTTTPQDTKIKREYIFNKKYAELLGAELMDEQAKHIKLYEDQIEVCDIYDYKKGCFYHSKIKRNQDSISHLFQQGYVSGASFAKFPDEFVKNANENIKDTTHHISGKTKDKTIHYLILSQSTNPRLSFFQKMSLEEKLTSLTAWGFKVKVSIFGNCGWAK